MVLITLQNWHILLLHIHSQYSYLSIMPSFIHLVYKSLCWAVVEYDRHCPYLQILKLKSRELKWVTVYHIVNVFAHLFFNILYLCPIFLPRLGVLGGGYKSFFLLLILGIRIGSHHQLYKCKLIIGWLLVCLYFGT